MPVVPVGECTVFTVRNTDSLVVLGIVNHAVPLVTPSSTASVVVWVTKSAKVAKLNAKVCDIVAEKSRGRWTFYHAHWDVCRTVAVESCVVGVFGRIVYVVALGDACPCQVVGPFSECTV